MTLYLFDLDGTLIRSFMREGHANAYDNVEVLPYRRQRLAELRGAGHRLAGVTNQGGVAFGYQTEQQVMDKMQRIVDALGMPRGDFPVYVCFAHPKATVDGYADPEECERRKPQPGMLFEAMRNADTSPEGTVFVGDMESDRQAAELAGTRYVDAEDFFGA